MRNSDRVFTQAERKAFMWVLILAVVLVAAITAYDWIAGPSLGMYGQDVQSGSLPGVLDAQPLS